ncbi:hypothetical protein [Halobaculum lipolyticum]|uniref:Uncharacterized protein n=1 Tax=Halobaculum lipolyticum TaxID=3032001 RepID=A0ABD5WB05_9EURY|nr:hypothetical protein [Halobaculum sp. DT31]
MDDDSGGDADTDAGTEHTERDRTGTDGAATPDTRVERVPVETRSDRRRRGVRQLLFVIAGSHTGAFLGSSLPTNFGLPGNVSGALLVVLLFVLPFVVDAKWERIEATVDGLGL